MLFRFFCPRFMWETQVSPGGGKAEKMLTRRGVFGGAAGRRGEEEGKDDNDEHRAADGAVDGAGSASGGEQGGAEQELARLRLPLFFP